MKNQKSIKVCSVLLMMLFTVTSQAQTANVSDLQSPIETEASDQADMSGLDFSPSDQMIAFEFAGRETCTHFLERNVRQVQQSSRKFALIGKRATLASLLVAYASFPVSLGMLLGGTALSVYEMIRLENADNVLLAIQDAHQFSAYHEAKYSDAFAGSYLKKLHRKINRKLDHQVSIIQVANALIQADEAGEVCNSRRGMVHLARELAKTL